MAEKVAKTASVASWKKPELVAEVTRLQRRVQVHGAERKHAEIDAERLRNAVDDASEGFALYDADERFVYANKKYRQLFPEISDLLKPGTRSRDHRRAYYGSVAVPEAAERADGFSAAEAARQRDAGGPVELQSADGTWLKLSDHRLADGSIVLVCTDSSEQKRAAETLRESESRLAEAERVAHVGSWSWDIGAGEIHWSDEHYRIFGVQPVGTKISHDAFLALVHADDRDAVAQTVTGAIESKAPYDITYRIVRPDGETRLVHALGEAVFNDDLKPVLVRGTVQDVTERKKSEDRLEFLAHHDSVTRLANRNQFRSSLEHDLANATRTNQPLAVLCLDLDRFEEFTDTHGHDTGDQLLKAVAERLIECCRQTDTVARLSADKFAFLVTNLNHSRNVEVIADKILKRLAEPIVLENQQVHTAASIGVGVYPIDEDDAHDLLAHADIAMYRAKVAGGNTVRYFDKSMAVDVETRRSIEIGLRQALERDEIAAYFQPIYDFKSARFDMAESLIRWLHPERGVVAPGDFIAIAEATGLIVAIGERVLESACGQCRWWQDHGHPGMRIAVNLSPVQLFRSDVVGCVSAALEKSGLDPADIEFEITEGAIIQDLEQANAILRRLKALGVEISLDDFGTGYSSLSLLKRVPVDKLKIDRSFVSGAVTNRGDREITRAVIRLASSLNLKVTAEGIENEAQFRHLRDEGCDQAQGYYFSRPLPPDDFIAWLGERAKS